MGMTFFAVQTAPGRRRGSQQNPLERHAHLVSACRAGGWRSQAWPMNNSTYKHLALLVDAQLGGQRPLINLQRQGSLALHLVLERHHPQQVLPLHVGQA